MMKLLDAIDKLRIHMDNGERALYKPLLLLCALAGYSRDGRTVFEYVEMEKSLRELFNEFWKSKHSKKVNYPFWS